MASEQAGEVVEAVLEGVVLRLVAKVPFAGEHGGVALFAEEGGEEDFGVGDASAGVGHQGVGQAEADGVSAGEKSGAAGGTLRAGGVKVGEADALAREAVEVGGS